MFLSIAILIYEGFIQPYFDYCADEFLLSAFFFLFLLQSCRSNIMALLYMGKPGDTENAVFLVLWFISEVKEAYFSSRGYYQTRFTMKLALIK